MATKICPHCRQERSSRGFEWHKKACLLKKLREKYANQIATLSPEAAERFLRKAQGG